MLQAANRRLAAASEVLVSILAGLLGWLRPLARGLAGSWRPPGWLRIAQGFTGLGLCWLQQRLAWLVLLALVAYGAVVAQPHVLKWWHGLTPDRVEPTRVQSATMRLEVPKRTAVEDNGTPNPVTIAFPANVAPIALVGKEAVGVTMEPALRGAWVWAQPNRLVFQPAEDWPVGQGTSSNSATTRWHRTSRSTSASSSSHRPRSTPASTAPSFTRIRCRPICGARCSRCASPIR